MFTIVIPNMLFGGRGFLTSFYSPPHYHFNWDGEFRFRFKSEPSLYIKSSNVFGIFYRISTNYIAYPPPIKGVAIVGFPLTSTKVRNFEKIKEKLNKTGGARV